MTEPEYETIMQRIEVLMDIPEEEMTTEQGLELDKLATQAEEYENEHYPIGDEK
jgi:antitoxin component HigA of HigAB toxin-antitoxin module